MPNDEAFSRLLRNVGRNSRYAGLGFVVLSIIFLILSVSDGFVVFEVDSIVAFLAAIFLLFRDPSARVQANVVDAILTSSDEALGELMSQTYTSYTYTALGDRLEDVVVLPAESIPNGTPSTSPPPPALTPPGRALAVLYQRQAGIENVTMDALKASLAETIRDDFGLARSVDIDSKDDVVTITLHGASATCTCAAARGREGGTVTGGSIGCVVASFLAVLVAAATKQAVSLEPCSRDASADTWSVKMDLMPEYVVKQ